ncbi:MAG: hypothetical protein AAGK17_04000 [Pseudomonadota bacterium]
MNEPSTNSGTNSGFDFNQPTIISLLYLGGFVTGISALVGVVLAHVWQGESEDDWAASHFTYLITTFWVSLAGFVIAGVLSIVVIGVLIFPLVAIWVGVRSVMSLIKAQRQEPMPEPKTLLF